MIKRPIFLILICCILLGLGAYHYNLDIKSPFYTQGMKIDSFNDINVYHHLWLRKSNKKTVVDGYNIGLEYQCVEYVKRYYFYHLNHRMPETYGNAEDFFLVNLPDGQINKARNLIQYTNPSQQKPQVSDLIVFNRAFYNRYGHVAIVSKVSDSYIETIQQNPGLFRKSRERISLAQKDGKWVLGNKRILGWLRKG